MSRYSKLLQQGKEVGVNNTMLFARKGYVDRWQVKDFNILKTLSIKQMSSIHVAMHVTTKKVYALKVYHLVNVPSSILHMISREIEIMSRIDSNVENIIKAYAIFLEAKQVYFVLEFCFEDLPTYISRKQIKCLSEDIVVHAILIPLLNAVKHLHDNNVCHRDIKPENIMFSRNPSVLKLIDFGSAIDLKIEPAVTRTGTDYFMAPEVLNCPIKRFPKDNKGEHVLWYGLPADIWSIGVTVYELLTGKTPDPQLPIFPKYMSNMAINFIRACLRQDATKRADIDKLLLHPWLHQEANVNKNSQKRSIRKLSTGSCLEI